MTINRALDTLLELKSELTKLRKDTSEINNTVNKLLVIKMEFGGRMRVDDDVVLGIEREIAARFSFLMVVPLIFGSMLKSIIDNGGLKFENFDLITISLGFISAFITGLLACKWMIALVKKSKLYYFSIYCFVVGSIIIFYTINGI